MLKKTLILTLTICAVAILIIDQPVYAQLNEFKITADAVAQLDTALNSIFRQAGLL